MPTADVSVRLAWPDDAGALAAIQMACWQQAYAEVLPPDALADLPLDKFAEQWQRSIARPADARQRVLVALDRTTAVGFAATTPSADPDADPVADAEVAELVIDPSRVSQGHGSRLLHAVADTLRSDHFSRATIWVESFADVRRRFLTGQGWAADGAHRELDLLGDGSVRVKQVRLHTSLAEGP